MHVLQAHAVANMHHNAWLSLVAHSVCVRCKLSCSTPRNEHRPDSLSGIADLRKYAKLVNLASNFLISDRDDWCVSSLARYSPRHLTCPPITSQPRHHQTPPLDSACDPRKAEKGDEAQHVARVHLAVQEQDARPGPVPRRARGRLGSGQSRGGRDRVRVSFARAYRSFSAVVSSGGADGRPHF